MASRTMHITVLGVVITLACGLAPGMLRGEEAADGVTTATHVAPAEGTSSIVGAEGELDRVRMVRELMKRRGGEPAAAAQLVQLVRAFHPDEAFAAFEDLAAAHERVGQLNLAAEARLMAVQAYPEQPAARPAVLWLTRLYASSEVAHHHRAAGQGAEADANRGAALYAYQVAGSVPAPSSGDGQRGDEPALVFARAVAARRAGVSKAGGTLLATLKHAKGGDPWGDCARAEAWLDAGAAGDAPKRVVRCLLATERPQLDGVLDEACWSGAVSDVEEATAGELAKPRAADVRWAWDQDFLYVAVRCAKAPAVSYPRDERGRSRDADLAAFDRVRLLVDVDRDYATCFELTVDSRGWTHDACWGDAAWNPEWFVAAGETDGAWTAEAAIGLEQLGTKGMASGAVWAVGVERTLPRSGDEERAKPRAAGQTHTLGPEAFHVLIFE